MTRILMVCLGNICRSPLAHGLLSSKLPEDKFYIDSAGTGAYHVGEPPDIRSIEVAQANNLDISSQKARQFTVADFDNFDIIFTMDTSNYSDVIALARHNSDIDKVKLFLEMHPTISTKNVPDPYYGGIDGFENVFSLIDETCDTIANSLKQQV